MPENEINDFFNFILSLKVVRVGYATFSDRIQLKNIIFHISDAKNLLLCLPYAFLNSFSAVFFVSENYEKREFLFQSFNKSHLAWQDDV